MKKEVTYYLEDTSRLNEISQSDLDKWIAEMPFHQPLQILASIKSEMENISLRNNNKVYAAYFAEDYELIKSGRSKNNNQRNKNTKQLATTIDIQPESTTKDKKKSAKTKAKKKLPGVIHSLADDTLEDQVKTEVIEDYNKIEAISEVSNELASELLEDEVISEVLEENISIVSPFNSQNEEQILTDKVDAEINDEAVKKEIIEEVILDDAVDKETDNSFSEEKEDQSQKVDYSEYSGFVSEKEQSREDFLPITDDNSQEVELTKSDIEEDPADKEKSDKEHSGLSSKKIKTKDKLKKKKKKKKKDKKKDKKKQKSKKVKEKDKKKKADKKEKSKKLKKGNSKKSKKSKKDKSKKKKNKSDVKGIFGKAKKRKAKKKEKVNKSDSEVNYVIVDSTKNDDFKLNDYDGVSSYTSWLLEQESINGNELEKTTQNEMKKSKNKKKKKKSKSLKIAVDSIKKQDSIISEPLANILALQGHKKKASKMYSKLAFVFPEKKEYFEEKIESLNK